MELFVTTTPEVSGYRIHKYFGIVTGEAITIIPAGAGFSALGKAFSGGSWPEFEALLAETRRLAIDKMIAQAKEWGANAIVGTKLDYETIGDKGGILMVSAVGTAVVLDKIEKT